jgi:hypothetical protein
MPARSPLIETTAGAGVGRDPDDMLQDTKQPEGEEELQLFQRQPQLSHPQQPAPLHLPLHATIRRAACIRASLQAAGLFNTKTLLPKPQILNSKL